MFPLVLSCVFLNQFSGVRSAPLPFPHPCACSLRFWSCVFGIMIGRFSSPSFSSLLACSLGFCLCVLNQFSNLICAFSFPHLQVHEGFDLVVLNQFRRIYVPHLRVPFQVLILCFWNQFIGFDLRRSFFSSSLAGVPWGFDLVFFWISLYTDLRSLPSFFFLYTLVYVPLYFWSGVSTV
jgi:hypothetical protein